MWHGGYRVKEASVSHATAQTSCAMTDKSTENRQGLSGSGTACCASSEGGGTPTAAACSTQTVPEDPLGFLDPGSGRRCSWREASGRASGRAPRPASEDKAGPLPLCLLPPTTRPLRGGTAGFFNRRLQATARLLFFQGANALGVTYAPVGVQYVTRVTFSTPQRLTQLGSRDEAHTQDPSVGFSGFFYSHIECVHTVSLQLYRRGIQV